METYYKGRLMRSQLEARWAAFFDKVGWEYDYEPALDLNGWLPDFILYSSTYIENDGKEKQHKILVEVKPFSIRSAFQDTQEKCANAMKGTKWEESEVLLLGSSVFKSRDYVFEENRPYGIVGWFYQCFNKRKVINQKEECETSRCLSEAYPIRVRHNKGNDYDVTDGYLFSRFNGYWDHNYGSSYCFDWASHLYYDELKLLWDVAGNAVQWRKQSFYSTNSV